MKPKSRYSIILCKSGLDSLLFPILHEALRANVRLTFMTSFLSKQLLFGLSSTFSWERKRSSSSEGLQAVLRGVRVNGESVERGSEDEVWVE